MDNKIIEDIILEEMLNGKPLLQDEYINNSLHYQ